MNSRTLRRLAADHSALHTSPLPPNYLFPPTSNNTSDDLTSLDILLAGPQHTPFAAGVWSLHLNIPPTYPTTPPTAHFRTTIFHPNVDPQNGAVCVETLKRDWSPQLTLRDVLITISCLLIQPNPDSALNAEAGALIREDFALFARRAEMMTGLHAGVPRALKETVKEAQCRGQEAKIVEDEMRVDSPVRRRPVVRQRRTATSRRSDGSPSAAAAAGTRRRQQAAPSNPFVLQPANDDVFGSSSQQRQVQDNDDSSSLIDADDQENDETRSPTKSKAPAPAVTTPRRPNGAPVPLGELMMEEYSDDSDMEPEYPPSPRKSPIKSPVKRPPQPSNTNGIDAIDDAESSRNARNITPQCNLISNPLASPDFSNTLNPTPSPRKIVKQHPQTPTLDDRTNPSRILFPTLRTPGSNGAVTKSKKRSPSSSEKKRQKLDLDAKLWELCGRDVRRWNRGDFDGEVWKVRAGRW